jgi:fructose-bisphosphate aldolase, class II
MSLVSLKEILADAGSKNYAVGLFNSVGTDSMKAIISGAEECNSPVILGIAEVHMPYAPIDIMAPMMVDAAKRAKVPVAVHLDHGERFETIIKTMHYGFSSVMFDGSVLDYNDNVARTREIVKIAKVLGVSVEAELGHVGGTEGGGSDEHEEYYTEPEKAVDFVNQTGIDALAIAIGTAHGEYVKKPCLDINRLSEIHGKVNIPLVLHGGSGLSDDDFKECIRRGIRKINIFTDMSYAATEGTRKFLEQKKKFHFYEVSEVAENSMRKVVMEKIRLFGSDEKA